MSGEKKIIIDEDWKSQVQAEKEAAAKSQAPSSAAPEAVEGQSAHEPADVPMPPASLEMLLTTLATEVLVSLGEVPHPATGKMYLHPHQAKYLIDTIDVLRQKTNGNLTPVEQQTIETLLHQLRMIFVAKTSRPEPTGTVRTP